MGWHCKDAQHSVWHILGEVQLSSQCVAHFRHILELGSRETPQPLSHELGHRLTLLLPTC